MLTQQYQTTLGSSLAPIVFDHKNGTNSSHYNMMSVTPSISPLEIAVEAAAGMSLPKWLPCECLSCAACPLFVESGVYSFLIARAYFVVPLQCHTVVITLLFDHLGNLIG